MANATHKRKRLFGLWFQREKSQSWQQTADTAAGTEKETTLGPLVRDPNED